MTVKSRLLELLEQHKGETLSGEDIGRELSCTRAAVWKAVNSLRQEGYPIEAGPNKGYMLARESNLISAEGIRLFLDDPLYRQPLIKDCSILQRSYRTVPRAKGLPVSVQAWIKAGQSVRYNKNVHPDIVAFRVVSDKDHALKNPLKQFSNIFSEQFRVSSEKRAYRFRNSSPYGVSSL